MEDMVKMADEVVVSVDNRRRDLSMVNKKEWPILS